MNNFATRLVRRSAGLPLPAAVRPALGMANISPSAETYELPTEEPIAQESANHFGLSPAEPAAPMAASPPSSPAVFFPAMRNGDDSPANTPEQISLEPRMDPLPPPSEDEGRQQDRATHLELPSPGSARITPPVQLPDAVSAAMVAKAGAEPDVRPIPVPFSEPPATPVELSPRPEPRTAAEAAGPIKKEDSPTYRETSPDVRNIHVKIGKVELRTTQPERVAPQPRPSRTSGFDDLRLTRIYLDRGAR